MNKVSKEQIQEWAENPVTEELFHLVEEELKAIEETPITTCLFPGEPQRTQENLVDLDTRRYVWEAFQDILKGDWSYFMEEDVDEETGY